MNKDLIIFDFDGTCVDTFPGYVASMQEYTAQRGMTSDGDKFTVGYINPGKYDLGWGIPLDEQEAVYQDFNKYYSDQNTYHQKFLPVPFDGIVDVLKELALDYDMAIATTRHRDSLHAILKFYELDKLFIATRTHQCAEEGGYLLKPAPDAVHDLLKQTKHNIRDVIVIGDTTADIGMANAAGTKSVAVLWGAHDQGRLQTEKPTRFAQTVKTLPHIIKEVFAL